jgi:hypothetical protein
MLYCPPLNVFIFIKHLKRNCFKSWIWKKIFNYAYYLHTVLLLSSFIFWCPFLFLSDHFFFLLSHSWMITFSGYRASTLSNQTSPAKGSLRIRQFYWTDLLMSFSAPLCFHWIVLLNCSLSTNLLTLKEPWERFQWIDSPAYVTWQDGMSNRVVVPAR